MSSISHPSPRPGLLPHAWKSLALHGGVVLALVALTQNQSQSIRAAQQKEHEEIQHQLDQAAAQAESAEEDLLRHMLADEIIEPFADLIDDSDLRISDAQAILADLREEIVADVDDFLREVAPSQRTAAALEAFKQDARIEALAALQDAVSERTRAAVIAEATAFARDALAQRLADTMSDELARAASGDLLKRFEQEQAKAVQQRLGDARAGVDRAIQDIDRLRKEQDKVRKALGKDPAKQEDALRALERTYREAQTKVAQALDAAQQSGEVAAEIASGHRAAAAAVSAGFQDSLDGLAKKDKAAAQEAAQATQTALGQELAALKQAQAALDQAAKRKALSPEDKAYAKALVDALDRHLDEAARTALSGPAAEALAAKVAEHAAARLDGLGMDRAAAEREVATAVNEALSSGVAQSAPGVGDQALLGLRDRAGALDGEAIAAVTQAASDSAARLDDLAKTQAKQREAAGDASAVELRQQAVDQAALSKAIAAAQKAALGATEAAQRAAPEVGKQAEGTGKDLAKANPAARAAEAAAAMVQGTGEEALADMAAASAGLAQAAAAMSGLAERLAKAQERAAEASAQVGTASTEAQAAAASAASSLAQAARSKVEASAAKAVEKTTVGSGMSSEGSLRTARLGNLADRVEALADKIDPRAAPATGEGTSAAVAATDAQAGGEATSGGGAEAASITTAAGQAAATTAGMPEPTTGAASPAAATSADAATTSTGPAGSATPGAASTAAASPSSTEGSGAGSAGMAGGATVAVAGSSNGMSDGQRWDAGASASASAGGEGSGIARGHGYNAYATYNHDLYERLRAVQAGREDVSPDPAFGEKGTGATDQRGSLHDEGLARQSRSAVVFVPGLAKATQESSTDGRLREAPAPTFPSLAHAAAEYQGTPLVIDGDVSDWGELRHPMTMRYLKQGGTPAQPAALFMRWSPGGLYFCWFVPGRTPAQVAAEPVDAKPYEGDLLEVYIDPENLRKGHMRSAPNTQQLLLIPFGWRDPTFTIVEVGRGFRGIALHSYRAYAQGDMGMVAARFTEGGYWVEAALSADALASPNLRAGMWLAANFSINRGYDYAAQQQWSAPKDTDTFNRPDTWGDILLLGSDAKAEIIAKPVGDGAVSGDLIAPGDPVRVRVVDPDMDLDGASRDRILAEARIRGGTSAMYVILEETAPDSAIFEGSFNTQLRYLPGRENTLSVSGGDTLQLFYADKRSAYGEKDRSCLAEIHVALPVFSLE